MTIRVDEAGAVEIRAALAALAARGEAELRLWFGRYALGDGFDRGQQCQPHSLIPATKQMVGGGEDGGGLFGGDDSVGPKRSDQDRE